MLKRKTNIYFAENYYGMDLIMSLFHRFIESNNNTSLLARHKFTNINHEVLHVRSSRRPRGRRADPETLAAASQIPTSIAVPPPEWVAFNTRGPQGRRRWGPSPLLRWLEGGRGCLVPLEVFVAGADILVAAVEGPLDPTSLWPDLVAARRGTGVCMVGVAVGAG